MAYSVLSAEWPPERIMRLRNNLGLTQGQFATRIGNNQQGVSGWETGRGRPGKRACLNMAAAEEEYNRSLVPPPRTLTDADIDALANAFAATIRLALRATA